MSDDKAVIRVGESKDGSIHVNVYSNDPSEEHDSIHINIPSGSNGEATITEKFDGTVTDRNVPINLNK